jgi:hypothetical protein
MNQPTSNGNPHDLIDHCRFVGRTRIAYFSMEIAISPEMPTYSGAHGILAGVQAAQTVWVSPTRHIQCGPNAWKKRVGLASVVLQLRWERRPSFVLGWAYHLEGGCSSQWFRSIGRSMDESDQYKQEVKRTIRRRHQTLYRELGFEAPDDPNAVDYYTILDLEVLGTRRYGRDFVDWLLRNKNPLEILFRLADEGGVVLLPGKGFGTPHPSARVSLANLSELDYARIGRIIRSIMQEYTEEYQRGKIGRKRASLKTRPQSAQ